jgi:hypothetical protein
MSQESKAIKFELTPEEIKSFFPEHTLPDSEKGFSDVELLIEFLGRLAPENPIGTLETSISYDGESELLVVVVSKPEDCDEETAEEVIKEYFSDGKGEDEDE